MNLELAFSLDDTTTTTSKAKPYLEKAFDIGADVAETTGDLLGKGVDFINDAGTALFSTVTSDEFGTAQARAFASNLFTPSSELTESMLNDSDIAALKDAVASAQSNKRSYFTYDDFGTKNSETLKRGLRESFTDAKARMAHFVGSGGKIYTDDEGNTIVEDLYDFNPGPRRVKFWEGLKAGTIDTDALEDASPIELLSILAYAAQENRRESGEAADSKIRINLGKLGE
jgi:hypothetical protein